MWCVSVCDLVWWLALPGPPAHPASLCPPQPQMTVSPPPEPPGASTSSRRTRRQPPGHLGSDWRSASQPQRTRWVPAVLQSQQGSGETEAQRVRAARDFGTSSPPRVTDTAGEAALRGSSRVETEPTIPDSQLVLLLRSWRGFGAISASRPETVRALVTTRTPGVLALHCPHLVLPTSGPLVENAVLFFFY